MGTYAPTTTNRTNFKGGTKNSGSHLIGWDSGKVRSERYTFKTGQWPVSKISFHYDTSVYDGKNIAIRCAISTSSTANVKKSGSSGGYAVTKNGTTNITISLKANTTYYIVFYPGVSKSSYGLLRADSNFKITQTTIDRGPCGAPTSLVLSRTVQIPDQPVELSWSGATGGTNTQIASYEVYYSTNPTAPDNEWQLAGSTTDASTTFNVTTPAQEVTHYYKVKTKSDPAGYDSPLSIASEGLTGNRKPEAPTIASVSPIKVPSFGGLVTFAVTASQVLGKTITLYYSVDEGETKTQFDGNLTIAVNQVTTFSFYAYDGTDYSNAVTQQITINDKPQIASVGYTTISTYTALNGDGINNYQLGYASEVTPTISPSEAGKVNIILEYYSSDNTDTWGSETITSVPLIENIDVISGSDIELSTCHIHKGISLGNENIHWRLKFILNDGIEDSDPMYFPNNDGAYEGKYYAIAHAPSLQYKYNQFDNSDITGTVPGQIGSMIRLVAYKDTSMTGNVEVTASTGANTITVKSVVTSYDSSYCYIDITLDNTKFKGEETISIVANLTDSDGCLKKAITGIGNVTKTKIPSLSSALDNGLKTIKPFTSSGTYPVTVVWPFGDYESLSAALEAYNCPATGAIKLVYSNDTSKTSVIEKDGLTWSKEESTLKTTVNGATIYTWDGALGYDVYAGKHKYYCRIEITNLFGETYATPWLNDDKDVFDFNEKAQSPTIQKIEWWKESESDWVELGSTSDPTQTIQKGMKLRFTCNFGLFTTDEVKVSILVRSNNLLERDPGFYDEVEEELSDKRYTPITYTATELVHPSSSTPRTAGSNTRKYIYTVNTDITTADIRHWTLKITNNGGEEASSDKDTNVLRQCEPTINFTTCKVAKDYKITYYFEVVDNGGGTCTYSLSDQTDDINLPGPPVQPTTTTNPFPYDPSNPWESKNIYIKVSSTVTGLITNTEIYYSKPILAYQVTPTVAYRPNTLGVNVENPNLDAMVDIHQAAGKSIVLVQGKDSNLNPTKFVMNPTTGQIGFYSYNSQTQTYDLEHALDLKTGQIITP